MRLSPFVDRKILFLTKENQKERWHCVLQDIILLLDTRETNNISQFSSSFSKTLPLGYKATKYSGARMTQGLLFHFLALRAHLAQVAPTSSTRACSCWWPLDVASTPRRCSVNGQLRWMSSVTVQGAELLLALFNCVFFKLGPVGIWPKRWRHRVPDANAAPLPLACPNISVRTSRSFYLAHSFPAFFFMT